MRAVRARSPRTRRGHDLIRRARAAPFEIWDPRRRIRAGFCEGNSGRLGRWREGWDQAATGPGGLFVLRSTNRIQASANSKFCCIFFWDLFFCHWLIAFMQSLTCWRFLEHTSPAHLRPFHGLGNPPLFRAPRWHTQTQAITESSQA